MFKVSGKDLTYDETAKTRSKSLNNKRKVNKENESSISLNKKQHLQPQQSQLLLTSSYSGNQQNNIQVPFIPMQINHNHLQNQYLSNQQNLLQHQSQFGSNHQNHMQQQTQYHSNQQNVSQILDKLNPNSNYMTSFSSQANYNQSQQALQSNWTLSNQYSNFQGLSPISSLSIPQKAQPINSATLSSENTLTFLQPAGSSDKKVSTSTIVYNPIDLEDEETQDFTNVN